MKCTTCNIVKAERHFEYRKDTGKLRAQCRKCSKGYETLLEERIEKTITLLEQEKKECSKCSEIKELVEFSKDSSTRTGYCSPCKKCVREKQLSEKETTKNRTLKLRYGVSLEEVENMLDIQEGECAICNTNITDTYQVDHCHNTGSVRGLLCKPCNMGIGFLKDDIGILENAIKYLE